MKLSPEEFKNLNSFDKEAFEKEDLKAIRTAMNLDKLRDTDPVLYHLGFFTDILLENAAMKSVIRRDVENENYKEIFEIDSPMELKFSASRGTVMLIISGVIDTIFKNYHDNDSSDFHKYEEEGLVIIEAILREIARTDVVMGSTLCRMLDTLVNNYNKNKKLTAFIKKVQNVAQKTTNTFKKPDQN